MVHITSCILKLPQEKGMHRGDGKKVINQFIFSQFKRQISRVNTYFEICQIMLRGETKTAGN